MEGEHIKQFTEAAKSGDYAAVMKLTEAEQCLLAQTLKELMANSNELARLDLAAIIFTTAGNTFFPNSVQAVALMLRLKALCANELDEREENEKGGQEVLKSVLDILTGKGKTP